MLLTRLPLAPKCPFDLHVLSLPPAFALSQDQTLRFIHHQGLNPNSNELPCTHSTHRRSQPSQEQPDTKPHHPRHQPQGQHPGADRASHPNHPAAHSRTTRPSRLNPQPTSAQHPAIQNQRTAKNQTLPKPMQLSKNNQSDQQAASSCEAPPQV